MPVLMINYKIDLMTLPLQMVSLRSPEFFLSVFKFIYLFLAVSGLHCCTWVFSSCGEQGLIFVAVHGLLIAVASLVAEHGL